MRLIKHVYKYIDQLIRALLGEVSREKYNPKVLKKNESLKILVFSDFLKEQPNIIQIKLLQLYLQVRHIASGVLKKAKP